jgi:ribosomal protein S18 acetylase RimI-like enzyme
VKRGESAPGTRTPAFKIRPAVADDADGIARIFLESAEHHASLDPARYAVPSITKITARHRVGWQHPPEASAEVITVVADRGGEIVGFVDVRLKCSPDPMHRKLLYCVIAEIAVSRRRQSRGVGGRLLQAAEA